MKKSRTKPLDLDDIGYIGDGRPLTEEESKLASEHIQAYRAKHPTPKRKPIKRGTTNKLMRDAVKAVPKKAKGADAKLKSLDDIGRIGSEQPYTDKDARRVSKFIQAEKAKREAAQKKAKESAKQSPSKRKARSTERP